MALIPEWMQQCGQKVLDNAGIVRDACLQQLYPWALAVEANRLEQTA
jgi:hypothetical protein